MLLGHSHLKLALLAKLQRNRATGRPAYCNGDLQYNGTKALLQWIDSSGDRSIQKNFLIWGKKNKWIQKVFCIEFLMS
jgi:hypothetical protein